LAQFRELEDMIMSLLSLIGKPAMPHAKTKVRAR
jgi:hypothetical protein